MNTNIPDNGKKAKINKNRRQRFKGNLNKGINWFNHNKRENSQILEIRKWTEV